VTPRPTGTARRERDPGPDLPEVRLHLATPREPVVATVVRTEPCTQPKPADFVSHIVFDTAGTPLEGAFRPGQSFGVIPPGTDERGRPHNLRLYSVSSPSTGEDENPALVSTTVKRTIEERNDTGRLYLGLASNHLCDLAVGDTALLTGPSGKRFLLPARPAEHDYVFFATGTGIAPYRGMLLDLFSHHPDARATLVAGAAYHTDLLYHHLFTALAERHPGFHYLPTVSRELQTDGAPPLHVQDRLDTHRETLADTLASDRTLIYICGVTGTELNIYRRLAGTLEPDALRRYLTIAAGLEDPDGWERRTIHRGVNPTRRLFVEVY